MIDNSAQILGAQEEELIVAINRALAAMTPAQRVRMMSLLRPGRAQSNEEWLIHVAAVLGFALAGAVQKAVKNKSQEHAKGN